MVRGCFFNHVFCGKGVHFFFLFSVDSLHTILASLYLYFLVLEACLKTVVGFG